MKNIILKLAQFLLYLVFCSSFYLHANNETFIAIADDFVCPSIPEAKYSYTEGGWIDNATGYSIDQPFAYSNQAINTLYDFGGFVIDDSTNSGSTFTTEDVNSLLIVRKDAIIQNDGIVSRTKFYNVDDGQNFDSVCETYSENIVIIEDLTIPPTNEYIEQCNADIDLVTNTIIGRVYNDLNGNGIQDTGEPGKESVGIVIQTENGDWLGARTDVNGDWIATVQVSNIFIRVSNELFPNAEITEGALSFSLNVTEGGTINAGTVGYKIPDVFGSLEGVIYEDINGDGEQNNNEPGIENITVNITDENKSITTFNTNSNGYWIANQVLITNAVVSVDKTTIPSGSVLTEGDDTDALFIVLENDIVNTGKIGYLVNQNTSSVSGFVYDDDNSNGIQDAGEHGIDGAQINVTTSNGSVFTTYTSSNGYWGINSLPADNITVELIESSLRTGSQLTEGVNPQSVSLIANSNIDTGALGYFIPDVTGSISGRVYNDINGNGIQDDDEPGIENVWIFIASEGQTRADVYTDINGDWIAALVVSNAVISIVESSLPEGVVQTESYPDIIENMKADTVVDIGKAGFTIPIPITTGTINGLVFNDENANGIFDDDEQGLPNVSVNITDVENSNTTVITDNNGFWTATIIQGNATIDIDNNTLDENAVLTAGSDPNTLTVIADQENNTENVGYNFPIPITTGTINGLVFNDENANGIFDDDEQGLPNVIIDVLDAEGILTSVDTDINGEWNTTTTVGEALVTIDENTLPENAIQTAGANPTIVTVISENNLNLENAGFYVEKEEIEEFAIYNAISPNDDGINDEMMITGISTFPYTRLVVYNTWGQTVYDTKNYHNENNRFKGYGNDGEVLPSGTYLFIFYYKTSGSSTMIKECGYLFINR